jgi:hypothetical protein
VRIALSILRLVRARDPAALHAQPMITPLVFGTRIYARERSLDHLHGARSVTVVLQQARLQVTEMGGRLQEPSQLRLGRVQRSREGVVAPGGGMVCWGAR